MTKIKLCGLMSARDAEAVNAAQPDYAGMILSAGFRRSVTAETALDIRNTLDRKIPLVGVFVNAEITEIADYAERGMIQLVQLHGSEDAAYIAALRKYCSLPVIKAFKITAPDDLKRAEECTADHILLDSGTGTGKTFDWALLQGFSRPYFLAGGLSSENVGTALAKLHLFGVDTSSGIETGGQKDAAKMREFVEKIRNMQ